MPVPGPWGAPDSMAVGKGVEMQVDLSVAQLLCSRLCHDLVGPIGAVNTGLELLDAGLDAAGQALERIDLSGREGSRPLASFRLPFAAGPATRLVAARPGRRVRRGRGLAWAGRVVACTHLRGAPPSPVSASTNLRSGRDKACPGHEPGPANDEVRSHSRFANHNSPFLDFYYLSIC